MNSISRLKTDLLIRVEEFYSQANIRLRYGQNDERIRENVTTKLNSFAG